MSIVSVSVVADVMSADCYGYKNHTFAATSVDCSSFEKKKSRLLKDCCFCLKELVYECGRYGVY